MWNIRGFLGKPSGKAERHLKPHILFCLDAKKKARKIKRPHPVFGHPLLIGDGKAENSYISCLARKTYAQWLKTFKLVPTKYVGTQTEKFSASFSLVFRLTRRGQSLANSRNLWLDFFNLRRGISGKLLFVLRKECVNWTKEFYWSLQENC